MHRESLPLGAVRYFRSRIFSTIPRGQRRRHSLRAGVWSRIYVFDGALRVVSETPTRTDLLRSGDLIDMEPGVPHHFEPVGSELSFAVHLYRVWTDTTRDAVARWENEGGRAQQ